MRGTWGERILPRSDQPQNGSFDFVDPPPAPKRKSWGVEVKAKGSKPKKEPKKVY